MASRHLLAAIAVLTAMPAGVAATALPLAGDSPASQPLPALECWLAHAQVQPPPRRENSLNKPSFSERYRLAAERHAGAEHPTAARLRPCNALSPPLNLSAGEKSSRP